jgi:hypothetical protein
VKFKISSQWLDETAVNLLLAEREREIEWLLVALEKIVEIEPVGSIVGITMRAIAQAALDKREL